MPNTTCPRCRTAFAYTPADVSEVPACHHLLVGNSTNAADVARLMGGAQADLCFTSPPYANQRDYDSGQGAGDWDALMHGVFAHLPMTEAGQVLVNLGLVHQDGEWWPYWDGWIAWMREQGWRRFGWYVWDQGSGLPGDWNGRFAPSHEFVFHFNREAVPPDKFVDKLPESIRVKKATDKGLRKKDGSIGPVTNPQAFAQPSKIPDSVIRINRSSEDIRSYHPAVYPVELARFILQAWPGNVYEPFAGSGTTLVAAEQLGCRAFGMEVSPAYAAVILQRMQDLGLEPRRADA